MHANSYHTANFNVHTNETSIGIHFHALSLWNCLYKHQQQQELNLLIFSRLIFLCAHSQRYIVCIPDSGIQNRFDKTQNEISFLETVSKRKTAF